MELSWHTRAPLRFASVRTDSRLSAVAIGRKIGEDGYLRNVGFEQSKCAGEATPRSVSGPRTAQRRHGSH